MKGPPDVDTIPVIIRMEGVFPVDELAHVLGPAPSVPIPLIDLPTPLSISPLLASRFVVDCMTNGVADLVAARWRLRRQINRSARRARRKITPPTTPPMMAPLLEEEVPSVLDGPEPDWELPEPDDEADPEDPGATDVVSEEPGKAGDAEVLEARWAVAVGSADADTPEIVEVEVGLELVAEDPGTMDRFREAEREEGEVEEEEGEAGDDEVEEDPTGDEVGVWALDEPGSTD